MNEKIRVVLKQPNEKTEVKEVIVNYEFLSKYCEGLIDVVTLPTNDSVDIYCNDEFLYNGMKPNIVTPENEGVLCGPLVFVGYDPYEGDSIGLTDEQVKDVLKYIEMNEVHDMSIERAYLYSQVLRPYQESMKKMEARANA